MAAAIVLLVILFALTRAPFLHNVLAGEEGSFGAMALMPKSSASLDPDGLPRMVVGSVEGNPILIPFERTIVPYIVMEHVVRAVTPDNAMTMPMNDRTFWARSGFLVVFSIGFAAVLAVLARDLSTASPWAGAVGSVAVAYAITTPFLVGASIQPQVDGSVGVLLLGLSAAIAAWPSAAQGTRVIHMAIGGILAGLGKHEWAIAFALSAAGVIAGLFLLAMVDVEARESYRRRVAETLTFVAGLVASVMLSLLISVDDYLSGFDVMRRILDATGGSFVAFRVQWDLIYPVAIFASCCAVGLLFSFRRIARQTSELFLLFGGACGICVGFMLSGWPGDGFARYYAPPLVIFTILLVRLVCAEPALRRGMAPAIATALLTFGVAVNLHALREAKRESVSISSLRGVPLRDIQGQYEAFADMLRRDGGVAFAGPALWIYEPQLNVISRDMGSAWAQTYLDENYPALSAGLIGAP